MIGKAIWAWMFLCSIALCGEPASLPLPDALYGVVNTPLSIWNESLIQGASQYDFDVSSAHGRQFADRWYHGAETDVGTIPLSIRVVSKSPTRDLIACGSTRLKLVPENANAGKTATLLVIGDSLTQGLGTPPATYLTALLTKCSGANNPTLTLVGSHQPDVINQPSIRHEGMGGWTASKFCKYFNPATRHLGIYSLRGSPFLYAAGGPVDMPSYYTDITGGSPPTMAVIFLGPNDLYTQLDNDAAATVDDFVFNLDRLVKAIEAAGPTKVGIMAPLPCGGQDGFGQAYANAVTAWQYRDRQMLAVRRINETFKHRVIATHLNVDVKSHYSATDSIHPGTAGQAAIVDSLFAWIKHQELP